MSVGATIVPLVCPIPGSPSLAIKTFLVGRHRAHIISSVKLIFVRSPPPTAIHRYKRLCRRWKEGELGVRKEGKEGGLFLLTCPVMGDHRGDNECHVCTQEWGTRR